MPTSRFQVIPDILSLLQREQPRSILDVTIMNNIKVDGLLRTLSTLTIVSNISL